MAKKQSEEFEPFDRNTRWCKEGAQAYQRIGWFTGWYDARMNAVLGPMFARRGIAPDTSRGESW